MNIIPIYGKILKKTRIKNNISEFDLAKKLGYGVDIVLALEAGRRSMRLCEINKWAKAVGADPHLVAIEVLREVSNQINRSLKAEGGLVIEFDIVIKNMKEITSSGNITSDGEI